MEFDLSWGKGRIRLIFLIIVTTQFFFLFLNDHIVALRSSFLNFYLTVAVAFKSSKEIA